jgi:hypothetical protein
MEDSCSPGKNKSLHTHRIYSIVIPTTVAILILEVFYVIANIKGNIGSALTIKGPLPSAPLIPK